MKNMTFKLPIVSVGILSCCAIFPQSSQAAQILWADWTAADTTSATGVIDGITVDFSGSISPPAQTSGGFNFWSFNSSTYTSIPEVDNPPPDSDIIRLTGGPSTGTQTITFSSPVIDPVMAILSMGQLGLAVTYEFDTEFEILNNGPGAFGNGPLTELPGNILEGREGHGIIQFSGPVSSISWTIPTAENWHGFTIGTVGAVPEPLTILGTATAAGFGAFFKRQINKKKKDK